MKFCKVRSVKTPERGTSKSAGLDFFVPFDFKVTTLQPNSDILIPSGIVANVPENCMLMAADKSGVATSKRAIVKAGKKPKDTAQETSIVVGAKIVDEDYQGEIHMHVINVGKKPFTITPGMKLVQFIVVPVIYEELEECSSPENVFSSMSERGDGGFGSTN